MDQKIRVFLAEDHQVVLRGLEALLKTEPGIEIIGSATDGLAAYQAVLLQQPDVLLLDLQLPHKTGLQMIPEIRTKSPATKIVVLTSFGDDETVFAAIQAGALSYLLKDCSPDELVQAIRDAHEGIPTLPADIAVRLIREINKPPEQPATEDPLTGRELEVLRLIARGMTNQEIADKLVVSERTVRTHVSNILEKLHLANRTQATLYALREGWSTLNN
jgi:NarL family two-component system response regulator LiaR